MTAIKLPRDQENEIAATLLGLLIGSPEKWSEGTYRFYWASDYGDCGTLQFIRASFWIANGFFFFHLDQPEEVRFRFMNKFRLWRAVRAASRVADRERHAAKVKRLRAALSVPTPEPDVLDATEITYTPGSWMQ